VLSDFRRFLTALFRLRAIKIARHWNFAEKHNIYQHSTRIYRLFPIALLCCSTIEGIYAQIIRASPFIPFTSVWISFRIAHWRRRIRLSRRTRFKRNNIYYWKWKWSPLPSISLSLTLSRYINYALWAVRIRLFRFRGIAETICPENVQRQLMFITRRFK